MFFEVFQPRVKNLLDAKHLGTQDVFRVLDSPVNLIKLPVNLVEPQVDGFGKIIQSLIIEQNAD